LAKGVKCRYGRLVFTLGYDSGHTLLVQESDSGLYQEGSIFRGHLGALAEKVPFLLMFGGKQGKVHGALGGQKQVILGWSGKWLFWYLPLRYSRRV